MPIRYNCDLPDVPSLLFDPQRQAVLLIGGDKAGNWSRWYKAKIPLAEKRYERWLAGDYDEER